MAAVSYDTMNQAIKEAKITMSECDRVADDLADILVGRLRKVNTYRLKRLKKELSQFNSRTGKWES